jgi:hypothetical protein
MEGVVGELQKKLSTGLAIGKRNEYPIRQSARKINKTFPFEQNSYHLV